MKRDKLIILTGLLLVGVVSIGATLGALYEKNFFDSSNNEEKRKKSSRKQEDDFNKIPEWNREKLSYEWNCNYNFKDSKLVAGTSSLSLNKENEVDNLIACVYESVYTDSKNTVYRQKTNYFPIFKFKNLNRRFVPLTSNDFVVFDEKKDIISDGDLVIKLPSGTSKETLQYGIKVFVRKEKLLANEIRARAKMKLFVENFISQLSYGPEIALLDEIKLNEIYGTSFHGVYTPQNIVYKNSENQREDPTTKELISDNNLRIIQNPIIPLYDYSSANLYDTFSKYDFWVEQKEENGATVNTIKVYQDLNQLKGDENFDGATFDVYASMATLTHEYGHHLSLFRNSLSAENFLQKLQKLFSDNNEKWENFKTLYKYFNGLNPDENKNWKKLTSEKKLTQYDIDMLKIFRKYYSKNVVSLSSEFTPYQEDEEWKKRTFYKLYYGLLRRTLPQSNGYYIQHEFLPSDLAVAAYNSVFDENFNYLEKQLSNGEKETDLAQHPNYIDKVEYKKLIDYINEKNYNVYVWDKHEIFNFKNGDSPIHVRNYWLISKNFPPEEERDSVVIGDIFNNMKYTLENTNPNDDVKNIEPKPNVCSNQPYTFNLKPSNILTEYSIIDKQLSPFAQYDYDTASKITDYNFLNNLGYYFSWRELLARMYAGLTFKFPDKRDEVNPCSKYYTRTEEGSYFFNDRKTKRNATFYDYGFLKVFGIDFLKHEKELMEYISSKPTLDRDNSYYIYKNSLVLENTDYDYNNFYGSYNDVDIDSQHENEQAASFYLLMALKVNRNVDLSQVKMKNKVGESVSAFNYDYSSYNVLENDNTNPAINEYDSIHESLLENDDTRKIVFKIGSYYDNNLNNQDLLNWNSISKVWIDSDNNGVFNEGEVLLRSTN